MVERLTDAELDEMLVGHSSKHAHTRENGGYWVERGTACATVRAIIELRELRERIADLEVNLQEQITLTTEWQESHATLVSALTSIEGVPYTLPGRRLPEFDGDPEVFRVKAKRMWELAFAALTSVKGEQE